MIIALILIKLADYDRTCPYQIKNWYNQTLCICLLLFSKKIYSEESLICLVLNCVMHLRLYFTMPIHTWSLVDKNISVFNIIMNGILDLFM